MPSISLNRENIFFLEFFLKESSWWALLNQLKIENFEKWWFFYPGWYLKALIISTSHSVNWITPLKPPWLYWINLFFNEHLPFSLFVSSIIVFVCCTGISQRSRVWISVLVMYKHDFKGFIRQLWLASFLTCEILHPAVHLWLTHYSFIF